MKESRAGLQTDLQTMTRRLLRATPFAVMLLCVVAAGSAQAPRQGMVRPLSAVKFAADDDVKCLAGVVENGDLIRRPVRPRLF